MTRILDIARKIDRNVAKGAGITLSADDLDLLVSIGLLPLIESEKQKLLEHQARIRLLRVASTRGPTYVCDPLQIVAA